MLKTIEQLLHPKVDTREVKITIASRHGSGRENAGSIIIRSDGTMTHANIIDPRLALTVKELEEENQKAGSFKYQAIWHPWGQPNVSGLTEAYADTRRDRTKAALAIKQRLSGHTDNFKINVAVGGEDLPPTSSITSYQRR